MTSASTATVVADGLSQREAEIDELVLRYQQGDVEAGEILVGSTLSPLITKLARLISTGRGYQANKPMDVRWVSVWLPSQARFSLLKNPLSNENIEIASRNAYRIAALVTSIWDTDDCLQEVQVAVLELAQKYKPKDSSFFRYVHTVLPLAIRNRLRKQAGDAMLQRIFLEDGFSEEVDNGLGYDSIEDQIERESCGLDDESASWLEGLEASDAFQDLTPDQRLLLIRTYGQGTTVVELAKELGLPESTVYKRRQRAVAKVAQRAEQLHLVKEGDQ